MNFIKKLEKYAETVLNEAQRVRIAKIKYLNAYGSEIKKAYESGYSIKVIADFATIDLLMQSDLPKMYSIVDKEGKTVSRETRFTGSEIKKICEKDEI